MNSYNKNKDRDNGIGVTAKPNERFDSLLKRFKRVVSKSGILKEVTRKRYYEKNSTKKKRKRAESINRTRKVGKEREWKL